MNTATVNPEQPTSLDRTVALPPGQVQGRESVTGVSYFLGSYQAGTYVSLGFVPHSQQEPGPELASLLKKRGVDVRWICG